MGSEGLEARLIGTLSRCNECAPSSGWLGRYSPLEKLRQSGLWLVQHLGANALTERDKARVLVAAQATKDWLKDQEERNAP